MMPDTDMGKDIHTRIRDTISKSQTETPQKTLICRASDINKVLIVPNCVEHRSLWDSNDRVDQRI